MVVHHVNLHRASRTHDPIRALRSQLSYRGWALNYELALPDDLAREYRLTFELPPKHHEIVAA